MAKQKKSYFTFFIITLFSLMLFAPSSNYAADNNSSKLKQIGKKITKLKQSLSRDRGKKSALTKNIKQADIAIAKVTKNLYTTDQKLDKQEQILKHLQTKQTELQNKLTKQKQTLAKQFRAAYMLGKKSYIKMLLNQQNPEQLSRMLTYYRYFMQDRLHLINNITTTLNEVQQNQEKIQQYTQSLLTLKIKQQKQRAELTLNKAKRQKLLLALNDRIETKNQKLGSLEANKRALEKVIRQLRAQAKKAKRQRSKKTKTRIKTYPGRSFAKLKGKLSWPTKGKIVVAFGKSMGKSHLKWNAVVIRAPDGQNIYAIAPGKVVYSKWMPNFGLLLIVDHGNGYMTLYGRNDALYKKVGDNVKPGELIAKVGLSGGHSKPGLYFAIRHNGKPLNPSKWCV